MNWHQVGSDPELRLAQDLHSQAKFPVTPQPFCVIVDKSLINIVGFSCVMGAELLPYFPTAEEWLEEKFNKGWEIMSL